MTVDLSKARVGDSVTLSGVIRGFKCDYLTVSLTDQDGYFERTYHPREIVSHTPKALSVGDRVRYVSPFINDEPDDEPWDLLFTDDSSFALVGRGRHTRAIKPLSDLERLP